MLSRIRMAVRFLSFDFRINHGGTEDTEVGKAFVIEN